MDSVKTFFNPPKAPWYEMEAIDNCTKKVKECRGQRDWTGVAICTAATEVAAIVFLVTNIVSTLMRAIEAGYSTGCSGFTATLGNGLRAEVYFLAVAILVIPVTVCSKGPQRLGGALAAGRPVTARDPAIDGLEAANAQLVAENADLQQLINEITTVRADAAAGSDDEVLQLNVRLAHLTESYQRLQEQLRGAVSADDVEFRVIEATDRATFAQLHKIEAVERQKQVLEVRLGEVGEAHARELDALRAQIAELTKRAEGVRVNQRAYTALMNLIRGKGDSDKVVTVAEIKRLAAS